MPKVSVIIPVYNVEKYLEMCLNSVCNQTLKDIEIICVNDCSTDNSMDILKNFAEKDNRIKLIDLKQNQDVSHARNVGIKLAQGEYIGFVDSDDTLDLDFYEKLYIKAKETNAQIVKGVFNTIAGKHSFKTSNEKIKSNKMYFFAEFTTAIYNTEFLKCNKLYFNEKLKTWEDPLFSICVTDKAHNIEFVDSVCYHYYRRLGSKAHIASLEYVKDWIKASKLFLAVPKCKIDYEIILYDLVLNAFFTSLYNVKDENVKQFAFAEMQKILNDSPEYLIQKNILQLYTSWQKMKLKLMAKKLRADL